MFQKFRPKTLAAIFLSACLIIAAVISYIFGILIGIGIAEFPREKIMGAVTFYRDPVFVLWKAILAGVLAFLVQGAVIVPLTAALYKILNCNSKGE